MLILGIETSCDDTAVALVQAKDGAFKVVKEARKSQIDLLKKYGGIVPEVAARAHADIIPYLLEEVLEGETKPDLIAATTGPGLITALLVGAQTAATLAYAWKLPLVAVNHIEGHVYSNWLNDEPNIEFPAVVLIVSGGHTELVLMKGHGDYELIGKTRDDAAGEAFDKVGKLLGFEYPGGPKISKAAVEGNPKAINLPRPMINEPGFEFSFAGLKTAALYHLRDNPDTNQADFCASFEQAAIDVLVDKTKKAAQEYGAKTVLLGGGVAANKKLREALKIDLSPTAVVLPPNSVTMDNATMIAVAGYFKAQRDDYADWKTIEVDPNYRIES